MKCDELADGWLMIDGGFTGMEMAAAKVTRSIDVQREYIIVRMLFVRYLYDAHVPRSYILSLYVSRLPLRFCNWTRSRHDYPCACPYGRAHSTSRFTTKRAVIRGSIARLVGIVLQIMLSSLRVFGGEILGFEDSLGMLKTQRLTSFFCIQI